MSASDDAQQIPADPIEVLAPDDMAATADDDWGALVEIIAAIIRRRVRERAQSQDQADTRAAN